MSKSDVPTVKKYTTTALKKLRKGKRKYMAPGAGIAIKNILFKGTHIQLRKKDD